MSFFDKLKNVAKSSGTIPIKLKETVRLASNKMGCYKIYYNGLNVLIRGSDFRKKN